MKGIRRAARRALLMAVAVVAAMLVPAPSALAATALTGTFAITAGSCSGATVTGSYIRMILPSGGQSGPFMSNSDSTCRDQTYTLVRPGTDGGLISGSYQAPPTPAFDSGGNALADRITAPSNYYGTNFATATSPRDPQTGRAVQPPRVSVSGGHLTADLRAFAVTWNNQNFNQGAPKPDGSFPGNTRAATGTYDASTGTYTLQWSSQVIGGPFDKFAGQWHLTGRFVPSGSSGGTPTTADSRPTPNPQGATTGAAQPAATSTAPALAAGSSAQPASNGRAGRAGARMSAVPATAPSAAPVASTTTITRDTWHVAWWLVAVALALGVLGVLALLAINRRLAARGRS